MGIVQEAKKKKGQIDVPVVGKVDPMAIVKNHGTSMVAGAVLGAILDCGQRQFYYRFYSFCHLVK